MEKKIKLALLLSLLSPFFGEVMSGSTPPLEIINPFSFLFLWAFYGGGVLLIREAWIRWGRGYLRLMLLGITYGIIEEGLAVKSFFDPNWMDLGVLATYGRIFETNMVWAVWLSIFHAVFSISIPILLLEIFYPEFKEKSLLAKRGLKITLIAFISALIITFFLLNPYSPPLFQYLLTFLLALFLIFEVKRIRKDLSIEGEFVQRHPMLYGTFFTISLFILYLIMPNTKIPFVISLLLGPAITVHLYGQMRNLNTKQLLALVLGILGPFLLFYDIVLEFNGIFGMSIVGIGTFLILLKKYLELK
ncbi:hypothetical protein EP1X_06890 [Thermococcus sp. EP1]|uniref:hypothetical protein n=1 Tax=Thermococcus sp. EP1 TaxID=1591054 RepID=UPI0006D9E1DE|nr:hypothetical protein [Thermococcus sp. EP1]KPU62774.1 hypothetical protein EP1X_06890 [Thermococcus sp. EP1]